jgi:serine/threonine-protein kinase
MASYSPTVARGLTMEGTLLGTFQYMSPEQLEGKDADHRADIWALGCVLYEMATGRRAFVGESQASLIGAILKDDPPPMRDVQPVTPPALDRLVSACLAKDPDERMQSARDVARELIWMRDEPKKDAAVAIAAGRLRYRAAPLAAIAVVAALLSGLAVWNVVRSSGTIAPAVTRFVVSLGERHLLDVPWDERPGRYPPIALSPDGRKLVYAAANADGTLQLYLQELDRFEARALSGTDDAELPFFSPDGKWVGFWANGALYKAPVDGGAPVKIGDVRLGVRGADWGRNDSIILGGFKICATSPICALSEAQIDMAMWPWLYW